MTCVTCARPIAPANGRPIPTRCHRCGDEPGGVLHDTCPCPACVIAEATRLGDVDMQDDTYPRSVVVEAARALGYTHVLTSAGPVELSSWCPYGGEPGAFVPRFDLDRLFDAVAPGEIAGSWPLLRALAPESQHHAAA